MQINNEGLTVLTLLDNLKLTRILDLTAKATFEAISKTYSYLTPDMWKETVFTKTPYQEFTDFLAKNHTGQRAAAAKEQALKQQ